VAAFLFCPDNDEPAPCTTAGGGRGGGGGSEGSGGGLYRDAWYGIVAAFSG
jgi:hypothetical protein